MDKLIALLNSFFSLPKIAAVSVPGILAAAAVAILLYPPVPKDIVPHVHFLIGENPSPNDLADQQKNGGAACSITYTQLNQTPASSMEALRDRAIRNQLELDTQQSNLAKCIELETGMKGKEASENSQWSADIEVLKKDQADIQTAYQGYEKSNNPLRDQYRKKYDEADTRIKIVRDKILRNEQMIRARDLRLAKLARESNVIADRLKDPGRLRPRQAFDDFITGLANHMIALALLAIAVGVLMNPINRAILGPFYDFLFE